MKRDTYFLKLSATLVNFQLILTSLETYHDILNRIQLVGPVFGRFLS